MKTGKEGWVREKSLASSDLTSAIAGSGSASAASGFSSVPCTTKNKISFVAGERSKMAHLGGETVETIWIGWMILKLPGVELMVSGSSWSTSFLLPCSPFLRTLKLRGVAVTMNGSGSSKLSSMLGMISSNF